jgi:hypothetical protein
MITGSNEKIHIILTRQGAEGAEGQNISQEKRKGKQSKKKKEI